MEIDIQEMTGEALSVDLASLKAEIVAEVLQRIEEERRLGDRLQRERALRPSALSRPQDLT
ncbi:MAG: hypothetical protein QNJ44_11985 [Rhodobacter sp.]|nr:hypothetical protein [Rhodobacter sp.]